MFGEKIENLIKAALADGEVTAKEREILIRKAKEEGIDPDEFEMVLDSRIVEMNNAKNANKPASNKVGSIKKCPNCGTPISGMVVTCPECGYSFSNVESNSVATRLFNMLQEASMKGSRDMADFEKRKADRLAALQAKHTEATNNLNIQQNQNKGLLGNVIDGAFNKEDKANARENLKEAQEEERATLIKELDRARKTVEDGIVREKQTIIKNFPVPNTKEDLLELLAMATSNAYDNDGVIGPEEEVWIQKCDQIYSKVKAVSGSDKEFLEQATNMIVSLMTRLPRAYKNFTVLPDSVKGKLEEEKKLAVKVAREKVFSVLKIYGSAALAGLILFILGCVFELGFLVFLGLLLCIAGIVICRIRFKRDNVKLSDIF